MDNLNIRGKNMPRRKKKVIRQPITFIKKTENGEKYNKLINRINNIIINIYNISETETETISDNDSDYVNKYLLCKEHILDKMEVFGDSIDTYDLLKKSIYSYKNDIKYERIEFPMVLLLNNNEHPYQFKTNIYDSILVKNFEQEWLDEIPFLVLNELYTLLDKLN